MIVDTDLDTSLGFVLCRFSRPRDTCHPKVLVLNQTNKDVHKTVSYFNVFKKPYRTLWLKIQTDLEKQWAADMTHSLLMRDPPQTCPPNSCRLTCQGQLPAGASSPPTILGFRGVMPHTADSKVMVDVQRLSSESVKHSRILTLCTRLQQLWGSGCILWWNSCDHHRGRQTRTGGTAVRVRSTGHKVNKTRLI